MSSTFRDFQEERDHLHRFVFPALEEQVRGRLQHLEPVDLRQGVEVGGALDETEREVEILRVCLGEVDRSRPYMIILLGDRYGWVPSADRTQTAMKEVGMTDVPGEPSVTALEIEYGLRRRSDLKPRVFVYLRRPLPYDRMPTTIAARCSDEDSGPRAGRRREALEALKTRLRAHPDVAGHVREYGLGWDPAEGRLTGLEEFGRQVLEDLSRALDEDLVRDEETAAPTPDEEVSRALREFVALRLRDGRMIGRERLANQVLAAATSDDPGAPKGVCVVGESGSGKSTLFAHLARALSAIPGVLLLAHAAGSTPAAMSLTTMVGRWLREVARSGGGDVDVPEDLPVEMLGHVLSEVLQGWPQGRRVVLLVDALDQFDDSGEGERLTWLPHPWPDACRLIATGIPGPQTEALLRVEGLQRVIMPPLAKEEARSLTEAVAARYHHTLSANVANEILDKRAAGGALSHGSPLWLTVAVEELNLLESGDFARAESSYAGTAAQRQHALLLDAARSVSPDLDGLYEQVLARAERAYGRPRVAAFMVSLAFGRSGWRESDLRALMPAVAGTLTPGSAMAPPDPLGIATLRRGFRAHLTRRGPDRRLTLSHQSLRPAILSRFVRDRDTSRRLFGIVASHVLGLPPDDPLRAEEAMFHLYGAEDAPRAAAFLAAVPEGAAKDFALRELVRITAGEHARRPTEEDTEEGWYTRMLTHAPDAKAARTLAWILSTDLIPRLRRSVPQVALLPIVLHAVRTIEAHSGGALPTEESDLRLWTILKDRAGEITEDLGDAAGALSHFRTSMDARERFLEGKSPREPWAEDLAISRNRVGQILMGQGDLPGALSVFGRALTYAEARLLDDRDDPRARAGAAMLYGRIGELLGHMGRLKHAMDAHGNSLLLYQEIAAERPLDRTALLHLSMACQRYGDAAHMSHDPVRAREAYENMLGVAETLCRRDPEDLEARMELCSAHTALATACDGDEALEHAMAAVAEVRELALLDPTSAAVGRRLAATVVTAAQVVEDAGRLSEASELYREALVAGVDLCDRDPTNVHLCAAAISAAMGYGRALMGLHDAARGIEALRFASEAAERLVAQEASHANWAHLLVGSYTLLGDALEESGDRDGAISAYERGATHGVSAVRDNPADPTLAEDLGRVTFKMSRLLRTAGRGLQAIEVALAGARAAEEAARGEHPPADLLYTRLLLRCEVLECRAELGQTAETRAAENEARDALDAAERVAPALASFQRDALREYRKALPKRGSKRGK